MDTKRCSRCRETFLSWHIVYLSQRPVCRECAAVGVAKKGGRRPVYEPSQEQIAADGKKIQESNTAGMTEEQIEQHLRKRAGVEREPYTIDEVQTPSPKFADAINDQRIGRHGGY